MRAIRIVSIKPDRNGVFRARGAAVATPEEQLLLRDLGSRDCELFGTIFGIPSAKATALSPQDVLSCETCHVTIEANTYVTKAGETKSGVNVTFNVAGKVTRDAAAMAVCDW
jgi:hypothetical protein